MRGSKYVQSDLGDSFHQVKELLEAGTPVLFSGVPCQVDGLKRFLGKDYDNLLTCDLVCHGVPSPAVFRAWLDGLEADRGAKVTGVRFKDKSHGWSHPWLTVTFADGGVYTRDFNRTPYGRGFGMQLFLRPACAVCKYTSVSRPRRLHPGRLLGPGPQAGAASGAGQRCVHGAGAHTQRSGGVRFSGPPVRPDRPASGRGGGGQPPSGQSPEGKPQAGGLLCRLLRPALPGGGAEVPGPAPLHYRMAARVLTPAMKDRLRKILK